MITPDHKSAAKEIRLLHQALDGVLMCCTHNSPAYDLAINIRSKLRQIHKLMMGEYFFDDDGDDEVADE
jgi:hypothetical protein